MKLLYLQEQTRQSWNKLSDLDSLVDPLNGPTDLSVHVIEAFWSAVKCLPLCGAERVDDSLIVEKRVKLCTELSMKGSSQSR